MKYGLLGTALALIFFLIFLITMASTTYDTPTLENVSYSPFEL